MLINRTIRQFLFISYGIWEYYFLTKNKPTYSHMEHVGFKKRKGIGKSDDYFPAKRDL